MPGPAHQAEDDYVAIVHAFTMEKFGTGKVDKIAAKLGISPRTVRGYVYRVRHPEKYKAAVQRYLDNKRDAKEAAEKKKAAKKLGLWEKDGRPQISFDVPPELAKALAQNKEAKENFDKLAQTYRRQYIGWIAIAKRAETKKRRIEESIALLEKGKKLGMK